MKIKMLKSRIDITVGKIYDAEVIVGGFVLQLLDDKNEKRMWHYPDDDLYVEVKDEIIDEPEQPTLRDQFAMAVIPPAGCTTSKEQAVYRYRTADAMMEARKK